jgi:hypothetical protein
MRERRWSFAKNRRRSSALGRRPNLGNQPFQFTGWERLGPGGMTLRPQVTCCAASEVRKFRYALGLSNSVGHRCTCGSVGRGTCVNYANLGTLRPVESLADRLPTVRHCLRPSYRDFSCDQPLRREVIKENSRRGFASCCCGVAIEQRDSCRQPTTDDRRRLS